MVRGIPSVHHNKKLCIEEYEKIQDKIAFAKKKGSGYQESVAFWIKVQKKANSVVEIVNKEEEKARKLYMEMEEEFGKMPKTAKKCEKGKMKETSGQETKNLKT